MTAVLNNYFHGVLSNLDGGLALLVTDRNGVPIVKAMTGKCPETATRASFLSTFATATEQASKLGLSTNERMICMYPSYQVVMFNMMPLVVTVIANANANTGMILDLENEVADIVDQIKSSILKN